MSMDHIAAVVLVLVFIAMAMIVDWIKRQARRISVLDEKLAGHDARVSRILEIRRADHERLVAELDQRGVIQGGFIGRNQAFWRFASIEEILAEPINMQHPVDLRQMERTIEALLRYHGLKMVKHSVRWTLEQIDLKPGDIGTGPVEPS